MSRYIFISYAIDDRDLAATICELLESSGRRCWLAPRDILPGSDWGESIIDAINQSQLMVLIYSDKAIRSVQVKREIERASSKGLTIIPFRTEEIPVAKSLEYFLSNAYWLDALSKPIAPHLEFLKEMVDRLMGPATDSAGESTRSRQPIPETTSRFQNGLKKRHFLPRSRRARTITAAIAIVVFSVMAYFGIQRWRAGGDFEAHYNQAINYMRTGEFDKSIEESNLAIAAAPANALGYRTRADSYYRRGAARRITNDFFLAVKDIETAIQLDPKDDVAFMIMGQVQMWLGDLNAAQAALTASLKRNSKNIDSLKARAYVYQSRQDYDSAIADLAAALNSAPNDVQALAALGEVYMIIKDYDKAVEQFSRALDIVPNDPNLSLRLKAAYAGREKLAEARAKKPEAEQR